MALGATRAPSRHLPRAPRRVTPPVPSVLNARVFTADPAEPWAEALAIRGDRIVAVGTSGSRRPRRRPRRCGATSAGVPSFPGSTTRT